MKRYLLGAAVGAAVAVAAGAFAQYPSPTSIAIGAALSDSGERRSVVKRIQELEQRVAALESKVGK